LRPKYSATMPRYGKYRQKPCGTNENNRRYSMSDLNRTVLIGRLTRDPELRYTPAGAAVASFTLANSKTFTQSGEKKEQVSFIDCVAWSKMGEIITEYTKKGHKIAVEGRLQQRSWDDQDGKKRSKVEVVVENFQFLESKGASAHKPGILEGEIVKDADIDNPFSDEDIPW
jgi:single-strand DNA-binding protein